MLMTRQKFIVGLVVWVVLCVWQVSRSHVHQIDDTAPFVVTQPNVNAPLFQ